jgi:dipeptidyl aminopeptidase/acylaminoacyl peptidase
MPSFRSFHTTRAALGVPGGWDLFAPVSPDGKEVALPVVHPGRRLSLCLLDLDTGRVRLVDVGMLDQQGFGSELAWSPDSRQLVVATRAGRLVVVHARRGAVHRVNLPLPPIVQVAVRTHSR